MTLFNEAWGTVLEIMILYTAYASKYICKEQQLQTRIQMQTLEVIKMENAKKDSVAMKW